jgi:hypothetical protein
MAGTTFGNFLYPPSEEDYRKVTDATYQVQRAGEQRKAANSSRNPTNPYVVLPDFTVNAVRPVFLVGTGELSRKSTRS